MTARDFRRLTLSLPGAVEGAHMDHRDFRVHGKIFATLLPGEEFGMVKLTPAQQKQFIAAAPRVFSAIPGGWGRRGATQVHLRPARAAGLRRALTAAWCNMAPKRLLEESGLEDDGKSKSR